MNESVKVLGAGFTATDECRGFQIDACLIALLRAKANQIAAFETSANQRLS